MRPVEARESAGGISEPPRDLPVQFDAYSVILGRVNLITREDYQVIDTSHEQLVLLSRAPFPDRPHSSTRHRWALKGVRGVRLETVVIGGRRYTSSEAIQRFINRLSTPVIEAPSQRTPDRAVEKIEHELDDILYRGMGNRG